MAIVLTAGSLLVIVCLSQLEGVVGTLTDKPENVVGLIDEQLQLQCASDTSPNNIQWLYEAVVVSNAPCVAADSRYTMAYNNGDQCYLNVQGSATERLSGPYACRDGVSAGDRQAQAIVIIIDPKPTCAETTTGQIVQGQNVTLSCKMDYYYKTPLAALRPGAVVTASISWETAAGTFITDSSIDLTYNGDRVGQSLQTDVWMTVTGTEIPSYKCTTSFQFSATDDTAYTYAVNSLTYDCISSPTPVWQVTSATPASTTANGESPTANIFTVLLLLIFSILNTGALF